MKGCLCNVALLRSTTAELPENLLGEMSLFPFPFVMRTDGTRRNPQ